MNTPLFLKSDYVLVTTLSIPRQPQKSAGIIILKRQDESSNLNLPFVNYPDSCYNSLKISIFFGYISISKTPGYESLQVWAAPKVFGQSKPTRKGGLC